MSTKPFSGLSKLTDLPCLLQVLVLTYFVLCLFIDTGRMRGIGSKVVRRRQNKSKRNWKNLLSWSRFGISFSGKNFYNMTMACFYLWNRGENFVLNGSVTFLWTTMSVCLSVLRSVPKKICPNFEMSEFSLDVRIFVKCRLLLLLKTPTLPYPTLPTPTLPAPPFDKVMRLPSPNTNSQ